MGLLAGTRLGPYEIVSPIGAGGMGEVYRARDERLKRDVAVKVLPDSVASDPDRLRRFTLEAEALARLSHPNVLTVHDAGVDAGRPYLVSELLRGETVAAELERAAGSLAGRPRATRGLPVPVVLDWAQQMAAGLAAAHEAGLVHRDLKPQNLFMTREGTLKILDFGLAKRVAEHPAGGADGSDGTTVAAAATEPGTVLGTLLYMSPEQIRGGRVDARSDLFAAGAILFELATGSRAFDRSSGADVTSAILRDEPPPFGDATPEALQRVIRRCLQKDPARRFQTARDLQFALSEVAGSLSASSASAPGAAASAPVRRRRTALAAGAVLGVLALAGWFAARGGSGSGVADGADRIQALAVLPFRTVSTDPDQAYVSDELSSALTSELSRLTGVRVISSASAMQFKEGTDSLADFARRLGAQALLEGSVQRAGGRLTITATLVDGRSNRQLWTDTYTRDESESPAIEREIAQRVAQAIHAAPSPDSAARPQPGRVDPRGNDAYLRGRFALRETSEAAITKAVALFNEAIVADPSDARPQAGLADAYTMLRSAYRAPRDVMPQAKAAAATAIQIDPDLAEAHVAMGGVLMYFDFDWVGAERELHRAIELSPNLAAAHETYALLLALLGRHETARDEAALAQQLDPLSLQVRNDAGWVALPRRRFRADRRAQSEGAGHRRTLLAGAAGPGGRIRKTRPLRRSHCGARTGTRVRFQPDDARDARRRLCRRRTPRRRHCGRGRAHADVKRAVRLPVRNCHDLRGSGRSRIDAGLAGAGLPGPRRLHALDAVRFQARRASRRPEVSGPADAHGAAEVSRRGSATAPMRGHR